ncbi:MAG TPA: DUF885 domain-containing protein [Opitutaceae bacterium]|nr:DUF885 domain-containing protein [Opitutaceae bacterium]
MLRFRFACLVIVSALGLAPSTRASAPAWVEKSNTDARVMLDVMGRFSPEQASGYGLRQYDSAVSDVGPGSAERLRVALVGARVELQRRLAGETDPLVRQDLQIMIDAAQLQLDEIDLDRKYLLPFVEVGRNIFQGEFVLLNPGVGVDRHAAAVDRLRRYTGLIPGTKPFTDLARAQCEEVLGNAKLLGPYRGEIEQELANTGRYVQGVRDLFTKNHLTGADDALSALQRQLADYDAWVRQTILPRARKDFRMPEPVYAFELRQVGIDLPPEQLIARAELEYSEVLAELQTLAPLVAKEHGWTDTDYRSVLRRLKQDQMRPTTVEAYYRGLVIPRMEALIRTHHVVTLPGRPMAMRIASDAESAVEPAPHMQPPPLIDNHGERGTFVLPLGNPATTGGNSEAYDDFSFPAAAWTLVAHEGRPGHELQFDRMVEDGVSYARAIYAFNSVNVEGWALYCETEMKPYEPLDAQLVVLQYRLLRAVRAFTDPMLNLGQMTRARAHDLLVNDVCLSEPFAREEVDRFTFRMPGQATSYFYGFTRLMELRAATQVALGAKFDRLAFNNFIVEQGLLPPDLLADAVRKTFIPAQLAK